MSIWKRVVMLLLMVGATGCISTQGSFEPNVQFVYPNSNVKVLGPTSAEMTKWSVLFFVRWFDKDEVLSVYREALKKQQGANVLVDFDQDTRMGYFLLVNFTTFRIRGQAAVMEVGQQELH